MAAKRLRPYFQAHLITVVSSAPLANIIGSRDATGRVAKWAIEIANHGIQYEPRTAIKSQALDDFLVDWAKTQYMPSIPGSDFWRMHFDGSKMKSGLGAGVVLTSPRGDQLHYVLQIHFAASNNVAEYEALVHGIKLAKEIGIRNIECFGDSDLVVQQCTGTWEAKDANMASYRFLVQQISGYFEGCEFHHVPRANNEAADALSKLGSTRQAIPPGVSLEHIRKPSIMPSPESESIFISETNLEALKKAKEAQPAKSPTLKKQSSAQGASAAVEPTSPGAADCRPGAASCSKKSKAEGKQAEVVPDGTASGEPMTSGPADCVEKVPATDEQSSPGAAECVPGAAVGGSEAEVEMTEAQEAEVQEPDGQQAEIQEEIAPQQAIVMVVVSAPSWAQPIRDFLADGILPEDEAESRQISRRSWAYTIINNELVRKSATGVFQRCVEEDRGLELLRDIHQGECGHHASTRAIASKAFRHGFYWSTALAAAENLVKYCKGCQRFKAKSHQPASALKKIPIAWPFAVWGLDMVGPFKTARSGMTHLLVAVDKFTKWIEARPIKKLDGPTAVRFVADIVCRYGVPNSIITDNGTNFAKGTLARYASQQGIQLDLASVAHPQSNGQVERANGLILSGIRPRLVEPLERAPRAWIEELPAVLFSLRTTPNRSTGFTPFFLVYGSEAIIPSDIEFDSPRHALYTEKEAKLAREQFMHTCCKSRGKS